MDIEEQFEKETDVLSVGFGRDSHYYKIKFIAWLKEKLDLAKEYSQFLTDELGETVAIAHIHGWRSTRYEKGKEYREKLGIKE